MKYLKRSSLLFFILIAFACQNKQNNAETETVNERSLQPEINNIVMNIEGMTCEIGCAKLIESKLAKTTGIEKVEVNFDNKLGMVTYDASQISEKELINVVEKIAGGDLYKVKSVEKSE